MQNSVVAIQLSQRYAILADDTIVPMTNFYGDERGDDGNFMETTPELATKAIVGQDGVGWWSIVLSDYESVYIS